MDLPCEVGGGKRNGRPELSDSIGITEQKEYRYGPWKRY